MFTAIDGDPDHASTRLDAYDEDGGSRLAGELDDGEASAYGIGNPSDYAKDSIADDGGEGVSPYGREQRRSLAEDGEYSYYEEENIIAFDGDEVEDIPTPTPMERPHHGDGDAGRMHLESEASDGWIDQYNSNSREDLTRIIKQSASGTTFHTNTWKSNKSRLAPAV